MSSRRMNVATNEFLDYSNPRVSGRYLLTEHNKHTLSAPRFLALSDIGRVSWCSIERVDITKIRE